MSASQSLKTRSLRGCHHLRVSGEHDSVPAGNAQDVRKGGPGLLSIDESRLNLRVAVHKGKAFIAQVLMNSTELWAIKRTFY